MAFWRDVAYLTSLGWLLALPIAGGVLLGRFIDDRAGTGTFWTLSLLGAGIGLAVVEAYAAIQSVLGRKGPP